MEKLFPKIEVHFFFWQNVLMQGVAGGPEGEIDQFRSSQRCDSHACNNNE